MVIERAKKIGVCPAQIMEILDAIGDVHYGKVTVHIEHDRALRVTVEDNRRLSQSDK